MSSNEFTGSIGSSASSSSAATILVGTVSATAVGWFSFAFSEAVLEEGRFLFFLAGKMVRR
jgi:hypothetical protein